MYQARIVCCDADNCDVAQLLIDSGANLEGSDLHFGRPLHLAALRGHVRSVKLLLLAGMIIMIIITLTVSKVP